jgi:hypothetical protein
LKLISHENHLREIHRKRQEALEEAGKSGEDAYLEARERRKEEAEARNAALFNELMNIAYDI